MKSRPLFLLAALAATGCVSNPHTHGGKFMSEYQPGQTASTTWTPYKATYVLYHWAKLPDEGPPPQTWIPEKEVHELYWRGLGRWDCVGFEKTDKGLFAVAGKEKIELEPGRYCWHISADTEYQGLQRVLNETGENVVYIAGLPFAAAAAIVMVPVMVGVLGVGLFMTAI